jgi:hypothetical protein
MEVLPEWKEGERANCHRDQVGLEKGLDLAYSATKTEPNTNCYYLGNAVFPG